MTKCDITFSWILNSSGIFSSYGYTVAAAALHFNVRSLWALLSLCWCHRIFIVVFRDPSDLKGPVGWWLSRTCFFVPQRKLMMMMIQSTTLWMILMNQIRRITGQIEESRLPVNCASFSWLRCFSDANFSVGCCSLGKEVNELLDELFNTVSQFLSTCIFVTPEVWWNFS